MYKATQKKMTNTKNGTKYTETKQSWNGKQRKAKQRFFCIFSAAKKNSQTL